MRGSWAPPIGTPESQLRIQMAKHRLEKEGVITPAVLAFRTRRQRHTSQPRSATSFADNSANVVHKRRRIR